MAQRIKSKTPTQEARIIGKDQFSKLLRKLKAEESEISQRKGVMGSAVEGAVADYNLHPDALRVFRKYEKKSPTQQAEFFLQLQTYWEYGSLGEPNQDLVETPTERKKRGAKKPEMKAVLMDREAQRMLSQGTHKIENGKVVPIAEAAE